MIGTKIDKPIADYDAYTELSAWCNENGAMIEDKGDYYECVEMPAPSKEEKLAALDAQYDADKAELVKYYGEAGLMGDTDLQAELRDEMAELDAEYAEERKAIEEGSDE